MKRAIILILAVFTSCLLISCAEAAKTPATKGTVQVEETQDNKLDLKLKDIRSRNSNSSRVFAVTGTNGADEGFSKLMKLMSKQKLGFYKTASKPEGLIGKDDVVLLKFNCQWAERGGTNTDLIKSVVQAIIDHPEGFNGEVIIADNGQAQYGSGGRGGSIDWPKNNALDGKQSVKKVAEELSRNHKVSAMTWDSITETEVKEYREGDYADGFIVSPEIAATGIRISYPKFKTQYGTLVSFKEGIWDKNSKEYDSERLKIINMPVLKSHINYNVTAAVKSYMGTTSDKLTLHTSHNSIAVGGMGTQMAGTRMPILNIIDAIWINPHPKRGPFTSYRDAKETNIVAASTDPAALDFWASKYILIATAKQLEHNNYQPMDPESRQPGSFGYWLNKSAEELRKAGIKAENEEKNISVYVDTLNK